MKLSNLKFRQHLLVLFGLVLCASSMQAQDDAQAFINSLPSRSGNTTRAGDDVDVMDLSGFTATDRSKTLVITNGRRIRMINGSFTRKNSLDDPIILLGGGSYLEIGEGCSIDASGSTSRKEAIRMEGGELVIQKGGSLLGHKYTSNDQNYNYDSNPFPAVRMTSDDDKFTTEYGSTIFNCVVCDAKNATVNYAGGYMTEDAHCDNFRSASDINLLALPPGENRVKSLQVTLTEKKNTIVVSSSFDVLCYLTIKAPKKIEEDILVKNCHAIFLKSNPEWWIDSVSWEGDDKYELYADYGDNTIRLYFDDAQDWIDSWPREKDPENPDDWHCGCVISYDPLVIDPYPLHVPCKGTKIKKDLEFPEDDAQWWIDGRKQEYEEVYDCEGEVDQGENDIIIKKKSTLWWRWLRWRGCGCQGKHIWVYGTLRIHKVWFYLYWRFIHVMPGGKVIIENIDGDCDETVLHVEGGEVDYGGDDSRCAGGKYGWYCKGGVVYIRGGRISGGTCGGWTGPQGTSYHYGGTVHGGIHNYGTHYWHGGNCTGGGSYTIYNYRGGRFYYYGGTCSDNGKIWNEGDLYIDGGGGISCGDIYCVKGGCIYILKKLTFDIRLVFTEENIVCDEPIVLGGDGYRLTQEDIARIHISLPDGYEWKYDPSCGCITIYSTAGISSVGNDKPTVKDSHNASGQKAAKDSKGLNIQRMSDGTVKKAIVK